MFFKGSRYERVPDLETLDAGGRLIRYKATRFIGETPVRLEHLVREGERMDRLAHRYFRNAERFWRICDANTALWPDDLLAEPGLLIGIPRAED